MTRPHIVMIAPGADGTDVGEAWSSTQWIRGALAWADVTVLTQQRRGRPSLADQVPGARVVAWPEPRWASANERISAMLKPGYLRFYRQARAWLRTAIARGEVIHGVHQVAPIALRYPCPAAGLGLPYVLGPLAGSLTTPPAFAADLGRALWYTHLRRLDGARLKWDARLRQSFREAQLVLGVAPYVGELLAPIGLREFATEAETGIAPIADTVARRCPQGDPLRFLYVGRLVPSKGVAYALEALGRLKAAGRDRWSFDVLGDGEERLRLDSLVRMHGLEAQVRLHGRLPRARVDDFYRDADLFLFPSLREPSGNVVFEALSHGLPVLACDRGGPGHVVRDEFGWRVPVGAPDQLAASLEATLTGVLDQPQGLGEKSDAALAFARSEAVWEHKLERMRRHLMRAFSLGDTGFERETRVSACDSG